MAGSKAPEGFIPPASQEEFDRVIADRLSRQKAQIEGQFADYNDLKAKAEAADAADQANKSELQKALDRIAASEKRIADFETADKAAKELAAHDKQVADWTAEVAKTKNVPADLLRGNTKEELEAHADLLKPAIVASRNGVVPNEGKKAAEATETKAELRGMLRGMGLGKH